MTDERRDRNERERHLAATLEAKAERKARARREGDRTLWLGLGTFGLVGWSVMIPAVLGIAAGIWLDARHDGRISWVLTGLVTGVMVGCLNAWYWIRRNSEEDPE